MIEKGLDINLKMGELSIPILNEFLRFITKKVYTDDDKEMVTKAVDDFQQKMHDIDFGRGTKKELLKISMSYLKRNFHKKFNRADFKNSDVSSAELAFMERISDGGPYCQRLIKICEGFQKIEQVTNKAVNKFSDDDKWNLGLLQIAAREYNWIKNQMLLTANDMVKAKG